MAIPFATTLKTILDALSSKYNMDLEICPQPEYMIWSIRDRSTGVQQRITQELILNLKPQQIAYVIENIVRAMAEQAKELKALKYDELKKTAIGGRTAVWKTPELPTDYGKLDAAYTRYIRNKEKRGQGGNYAGVMQEIFPQTAMYSSSSVAFSTFSMSVPYDQQSVTVKPVRKTAVMPHSKKRAITLEDL
jgi:hypothetical protein